MVMVKKKLSKRERHILGLLLSELTSSDQSISLDDIIRKDKELKPKAWRPSLNVRQRMRNVLYFLELKLAARDISFARVSQLGPGRIATYAFKTEAALRRAQELFADEGEELDKPDREAIEEEEAHEESKYV